MRVRIHRGTQEIGGTCIEVESQGKRIVPDVRLPLDAATPDEHELLLPDVPGFRQPDDSLLCVVMSDPHMDHFGLARHMRPEVPVHIGQGAASYDLIPQPEQAIGQPRLSVGDVVFAAGLKVYGGRVGESQIGT